MLNSKLYEMLPVLISKQYLTQHYLSSFSVYLLDIIDHKVGFAIKNKTNCNNVDS
jgi:hypothetical protein